MTNQLILITPDRSWRLDDATRRRGREGVAAARAVLRASRVQAREAALAEGEALDLHRDAA
jgi:hypothetical protein